MTREEMKTGMFVRGTHPNKHQTGKDHTSRVLIKLFDDKTGLGSIYNFCQNGRACGVHGHVETLGDVGLLNATDEKFIASFFDFTSFLGIEFGDVLPDSFLSKCNLDASSMQNSKLEDMTPIFVGRCIKSRNNYATSYAITDKIHVAFVKTDGNDGGFYTPHVNLSEDEFISLLTNEEQKKMSVYYINNEGVKTKGEVNSMDEIKDLKEFLYKFDN